jgi:hypothetical protein
MRTNKQAFRNNSKGVKDNKTSNYSVMKTEQVWSSKENKAKIKNQKKLFKHRVTREYLCLSSMPFNLVGS